MIVRQDCLRSNDKNICLVHAQLALVPSRPPSPSSQLGNAALVETSGHSSRGLCQTVCH